MTNVDSSARPANNIERKIMFTYLTEKLPWNFGYARKVANQLNDSGLKSIRGGDYSTNIVYQIVDKGFNDFQVERALVSLNETYFGKTIAEICPEYVPSF